MMSKVPGYTLPIQSSSFIMEHRLWRSRSGPVHSRRYDPSPSSGGRLPEDVHRTVEVLPPHYLSYPLESSSCGKLDRIHQGISRCYEGPEDC
jgi:hypothetical protein